MAEHDDEDATCSLRSSSFCLMLTDPTACRTSAFWAFSGSLAKLMPRWLGLAVRDKLNYNGLKHPLHYKLSLDSLEPLIKHWQEWQGHGLVPSFPLYRAREWEQKKRIACPLHTPCKWPEQNEMSLLCNITRARTRARRLVRRVSASSYFLSLPLRLLPLFRLARWRLTYTDCTCVVQIEMTAERVLLTFLLDLPFEMKLRNSSRRALDERALCDLIKRRSKREELDELQLTAVRPAPFSLPPPLSFSHILQS